MTWVKHSDDFSSNPKVLGLSDRAYRLHFCSLEYCARHLTDGLVSRLALRLTGANANLSRPGSTAKELVKAGLWKEAGDGFEIHDYLEYNPKAAQVKEERKAAAERMRRVRAARSGVRSGERSPERSGSLSFPVLTTPEPPKPKKPKPGPKASPNDVRDSAFRAYRAHGGQLKLEKERNALARGVTSLLTAGHPADIIVAAAGDLGRDQAFPGYLKQRVEQIIANGGVCKNRGLDRSKLTVPELQACGCKGDSGCAAWAEALGAKA